MSRYYVKPLSILASNKMHLVPKMTPLRLIETMEDISSWKEKNCDSAVKLFASCSARLVSLLPELKVSEISRILFTYNKAGIEYKFIIPMIKNFILQHSNLSDAEEYPFYKCCVNDLLLLYKGFEINRVFDYKIHNLIIEHIVIQKKYMTNTDISLFLKSHFNYLEYNKHKEDSLTHYLHPELLNEVIHIWLNSPFTCTPEDVTSFIKNLVFIFEFYEIKTETVTLLSQFLYKLSNDAVKFNINQILRIILSICKLVKREPNVCEQFNDACTNIITSLLEEANRRNDIMTFSECLELLHHLNEIKYWNMNLMKGMLYCKTNGVREIEDSKVYEIIYGKINEHPK
ncbi:hypothetical protein TpMuguga_04g00281 [Theileria parva strain Muguga]|uniref:uncharacterized protein n=1 Tax=Theileria parva strain Muguga TaxID=333668 RepID=UPI001C61EA3B|nr:uncharacterized protein TpMuguga_04g00281 [Theileria parva strain Muguga]EAN31633.2 hypothetical protein TpMuguga_04g00281 [Theileria parva strain Muguga]